jgi:hypothetical protein
MAPAPGARAPPCPLSTGRGTRRVQLVREGGGGGETCSCFRTALQVLVEGARGTVERALRQPAAKGFRDQQRDRDQVGRDAFGGSVAWVGPEAGPRDKPTKLLFDGEDVADPRGPVPQVTAFIFDPTDHFQSCFTYFTFNLTSLISLSILSNRSFSPSSLLPLSQSPKGCLSPLSPRGEAAQPAAGAPAFGRA